VLNKGVPARRLAGYFLPTVLQPGVAHFMSRSGGDSLPALHVVWRRLCPKWVTRVASIISTPDWARPGMYDLTNTSRVSRLAELDWN